MLANSLHQNNYKLDKQLRFVAISKALAFLIGDFCVLGHRHSHDFQIVDGAVIPESTASKIGIK